MLAEGSSSARSPILWELGPHTSPCSPTCFCSACLKKSLGCRQGAGQDLLCTKPQIRIMHETKGDSYKISDGKLKKQSVAASITPCHATWLFLNELAPHSSPGWSFACKRPPAWPVGMLHAGGLPLQQGRWCWQERGPNPPDLCRGTACPHSPICAAGLGTMALPHPWPAAPSGACADFCWFFPRKILTSSSGL